MPAFLIERQDRAISGDAIWASTVEEAETFLQDGDKAVHQQSDILAEMMKLEPTAGRHADAFYKYVVASRNMSGQDLPHPP